MHNQSSQQKYQSSKKDFSKCIIKVHNRNTKAATKDEPIVFIVNFENLFNNLKKKHFWNPFLRTGFNYLKAAKPWRGDNLLLITNSCCKRLVFIWIYLVGVFSLPITYNLLSSFSQSYVIRFILVATFFHFPLQKVARS